MNIPGSNNQQVNPANPGANPGGGLDLVQEIARTINETNFMRRNRRLIF